MKNFPRRQFTRGEPKDCSVVFFEMLDVGLGVLGCLTSDLRTIENNLQPKYHVAVVNDTHGVREGSGIYWGCHLGRCMKESLCVIWVFLN